jgi:hypothetical protein
LGLRLFAPQKFPCAYAPILISPHLAPPFAINHWAHTEKLNLKFGVGKNLEFVHERFLVFEILSRN